MAGYFIDVKFSRSFYYGFFIIKNKFGVIKEKVLLCVMKYKTIKIDSKIASKVKKHVQKRGMTMAFYVSHKLDHALKADIATELIRDSITQPKD